MWPRRSILELEALDYVFLGCVHRVRRTPDGPRNCRGDARILQRLCRGVMYVYNMGRVRPAEEIAVFMIRVR
jgi:hypothetical protein